MKEYTYLETDLRRMGVYVEDDGCTIGDDSNCSYLSWDITEDIISDQLYEDYRERVKVKRTTLESYSFERNAGKLLMEDAERIFNRTWKPEGYKNFKVFHPERVISAPFYHDRIVEYWLTERYIAPYVIPQVIYENMACQKDKGPTKAHKYINNRLNDLYALYESDFYFIKTDIEKYYDNLNHEVIKEKFSRMQELPRILLNNILDGWQCEDCYAKEMDPDGIYGIPKGTLPSQWIGIFYLDEVDWLIHDNNKCLGYVRYMDDIVAFFRTKKDANECILQIRNYLADNKMGIRLHPRKTIISPMKNGFTFCGFRYHFNGSGILKKSIRIDRKKLIKNRYGKMRDNYYKGCLSDGDVERKKNGTEAYLKQGTNKKFIRYINHRYMIDEDRIDKYANDGPPKKKHEKPSRKRRREKRKMMREKDIKTGFITEPDGQLSFLINKEVDNEKEKC